MAEFQRILARLKSLKISTRNEQVLEAGLTTGIECARKQCAFKNVAFVVQIDSTHVDASFDLSRMAQATTWTSLALSAAVDRLNEPAKQRLITIDVRVGEDEVAVEIAQSADVFESLPYFFDVDVVAHWQVEAAKLLFQWEGITLEQFNSGRYGGFRFSIPLGKEPEGLTASAKSDTAAPIPLSEASSAACRSAE
jgi:hypothetical protein